MTTYIRVFIMYVRSCEGKPV